MSFTNVLFFGCFLPAVLIIYWLLHRSLRMQNVVLLAASFVFYVMFDPRYLLFLTAVIVIAYAGAIISDRSPSEKGHKRAAVISMACIVLILVIFKYADFIVSIASRSNDHCWELILPVGLSFYIFQAYTYLYAVMKKEMEAEKNFIALAVFISFFPTIVSGPIQRAKEFLPKLHAERTLSWDNFRACVYRFLWGAFLKMVIADRVGILVDSVFDYYQYFAGVPLILTACAYSVQLYADFSGYSYMAIAVAGLFGFPLKENFHQPYFATSIHAFWSRWHISLSTWLRDYVYIPLGGNRKGTARKYINILIVFLISGIWHGAGFSFIVWGLLHGMYEVIGAMTAGFREKAVAALGINRKDEGWKLLQLLFTFMLVTIAWVFFRAPSVGYALGYLRKCAAWNPWTLFDGSLFELGLDRRDFMAALVSIAILIVVSVLRERGFHAVSLARMNIVTRYAVFLAMVLVIAVFGIYGPSYSAANYIYAGF